MRIALVTSGLPHCGIAEYGKNLIKHLPEIDWTIVPHNNLGAIDNYDIVHLNFEPGLFPKIQRLQPFLSIARGTVLTLHTTHEGVNANELTAKFGKVVVHEKTSDNFVHIPMGIPDVLSQEDKATAEMVKQYRSRDICSVGFPFPKKGFPEVAQAAAILGKTAMFILPPGHGEREAIIAECEKRNHGKTHYVTDWFNERDTIKLLRTTDVAVFAYHGGDLGISGAIRLALAAELPTVAVRSCRQFRDLLDYEDEIEFVDSPSPELLAQGISNVLENGKKPKRVLEDMSWQKSAQAYLKLYNELIT